MRRVAPAFTLLLLFAAVVVPPTAAADTVRVMVAGDTGVGSNAKTNVAKAVAGGAATFLGLGDYDYGAGDDAWRAVFSPIASKRLTIGNHDVASDYADLVPGSTTYWSAAVGGVRIVGIDTQKSMAAGSTQYTWAKNALCDAAEPVRVLAMHKGWWLLSGARHPGSEFPGSATAMDALVRDCGVDLVLAGHEHNYQRRVKDGVTYVIAGAGGQSAYPLSGIPSGTVRTTTATGHLRLDLRADGYDAAYVALDGSVKDTFAYTATTAPAVWEPHAESFPVKSTGGVTTRTSFEGGRGWNLWANGYVQQAADAAHADATLTVRAQGQLAGGVAPVMVVTEAGAERARVSVPATLGTFEVPLGPVAKGAAIRVAYVNDAKTATEDRNLLLDTVVLAATHVVVPPNGTGNATGGGNATTNATAAFDATFRNVRGNLWWVETDVAVANGTLAGVDARVGEGPWTPLAKTAWGSWAKGLAVPAGSWVTFRARAADGATDASTAYPWPP